MSPRNNTWLAFRRRYLAGKQNHEGYYVCEICGSWNRQIDLHHLVRRSRGPGRRYDQSNIRLLCRPCHSARH